MHLQILQRIHPTTSLRISFNCIKKKHTHFYCRGNSFHDFYGQLTTEIRHCTTTTTRPTDEYEEEQQKKQIKSLEFYEKWAKERHYFYYIDLQGRLFLEDTLPKNIATSLKSHKFLSFFWKNLALNRGPLHSDYPYVSPCGKEMNYIKVADSPFVFQELQDDKLIYGQSLSIPFDPTQLGISSRGRLYHRLPMHKHLPTKWGLIKSHLALQLSSHITFSQQQPEQHSKKKGKEQGQGEQLTNDTQELQPLFTWKGKEFIINQLSFEDNNS